MLQIRLYRKPQHATWMRAEIALHHADGSTDSIQAKHDCDAARIAGLKAGSALNLIKEQGVA